MRAQIAFNIKTVSITMDFSYPPIPAGEKIITAETNGLIYPVFGDNKRIEQWNFATCNDGFIDPSFTLKLSDGDLHWVSQLSRISDPQTGQEKFVIFDDKQIYIIESVNHKNKLTIKPRVDQFVDADAFIAVCPSVNSEVDEATQGLPTDPVVRPIIQLRSFYCVSSHTSASQDCVLYDFLDEGFSLELPFKAACGGVIEISFVSRITSYKNSYVLFTVTELCPDERFIVSLYAIKEKDLLQKLSGLTVADFISTKLSTNDYPISIFKDHFYYDDQNTGSEQFVLCLNNNAGDTISLQIFEIDDTPKFVNTASYSSSYTNTLLGLTPIKQRLGLVAYVLADHGPVFFLNNTTLEIN